MKNRKNGLSVVSETNLGIYVWQLLDGSYLMDGDFNVLSINAFRNDIRAITKIGQVARNLGFEGSAVFVEGSRKISDTEFEVQKERFFAGLQPDPYDIGVYKENL